MGIIGNRVHEIADRVPCPAPTCYCTRAGSASPPPAESPPPPPEPEDSPPPPSPAGGGAVRGLVQHRSVPVALQLAPMQRVLGVRPVGDAAAYAERPLHGLVQHRALPEPLPVGQLQRVLELSLA